ncbi:MAG: hypothetical protein ABGZ17_25535 [Planctomycetaceae bacterium]
MTENGSNETKQPTGGTESDGPAQPQAEMETDQDSEGEAGIMRFLGLIVPMAVVAGICGVVWATVDLPDLLPDFFRPPMAEFHGQVFYNGKPLNGASIESKPLQKGRRGSIGFSEPDGRFQMMTDIEGKYVMKTYVGDYQLRVAAFGQNQGASPPPRITPERYHSFEGSGLTMQVTQDKASNTIEIRLVD